MSGNDDDLDDLLGPEPVAVADPPENLVDEQPPGYRPMGEASRALLERSRSYPVGRAAKKNTPERLNRLLLYVAEMPVTADACRRAAISVTTLKYWLQKSSEGAPGDGFDIALGEEDETESDDNTIRFHEAWDIAMLSGVERLEAVTIRRATGYDETLSYQGRVQYKYDPAKLATARELGLSEYVPENYLLDEFGAPVPETIWKMDPDLAMFILKCRKPQVYGNKATVDMNVRGGVLVVPMRAVIPGDLNEAEEKFRKLGRPNIIFEEGDDDDV
jgi:hypothetical protein